ncbi:hypothetical protein [Salipaludibacillus sp. CF4.18]|uniref:hypothetical protein n=1 Tax=Salipaludibacillus sp. CF4.18 TaxID=3373081 RepID=UPI003EE75549
MKNREKYLQQRRDLISLCIKEIYLADQNNREELNETIMLLEKGIQLLIRKIPQHTLPKKRNSSDRTY